MKVQSYIDCWQQTNARVITPKCLNMIWMKNNHNSSVTISYNISSMLIVWLCQSNMENIENVEHSTQTSSSDCKYLKHNTMSWENMMCGKISAVIWGCQEAHANSCKSTTHKHNDHQKQGFMKSLWPEDAMMTSTSAGLCLCDGKVCILSAFRVNFLLGEKNNDFIWRSHMAFQLCSFTNAFEMTIKLVLFPVKIFNSTPHVLKGAHTHWNASRMTNKTHTDMEPGSMVKIRVNSEKHLFIPHSLRSLGTHWWEQWPV